MVDQTKDEKNETNQDTLRVKGGFIMVFIVKVCV